MMKISHLWLLDVTDDARAQISDLSSKDHSAIFRTIVVLLRANDPHLVSDVKKLQEKRFEGQYRQRQGDYRIFFSMVSGETTFLKFTYKGKLQINAVLHRSKAYE